METENWNDRLVKQRFYLSNEWKSLRKYVLSQTPFCKKCLIEGKLIPSTVVDHIVDISVDPLSRLTLENLQSLCTKCHNEKTAKGRKSFVKGMTQQTLLNRNWKMK